MPRMFRTALIATAAMSLLSAPVFAGEDEQDEAQEMSKGEKELAKLLEGRVAGEPTRCIRTFPSNNLRVIDDTALVYGRGRTIYVNTTAHPEDLDDDDVLVIRKFGSSSQLCRLDNVTTVDRYSGFFSGVVFLEDFVPYTRVEDADS